MWSVQGGETTRVLATSQGRCSEASVLESTIHHDGCIDIGEWSVYGHAEDASDAGSSPSPSLFPLPP